MELNVQDWKEFNLLKLCKIDMGNKFDNDKMSHDNPSINFVSRTGDNNGVSDFVDKVRDVEPYPSDSITVALGGSIGSCFLQTKPFYTGQNVSVLLFDDAISNQAKLFITTMFMNECKYKYVAFGRELNVHIRKDFVFCLPIQHNADGSPLIDSNNTYSNDGYVPDWQFMENYIKSLRSMPITTTKLSTVPHSLGVEQWKGFYIGNVKEHAGIFNLVKGTRLTKENMTEGTTHFLGAIDDNNGVRDYIGQKPLCKAGCVTVNYNGSVGEAFYQDKPFWASDDVTVLYPTDWKITPNIGLFLATIIRADKYRFTYGRKWDSEKMMNSVMKLPIQWNASNKPIVDKAHKYSSEGYIPDWNFMEMYIDSLPYSDRI